MHSLQTSMHSLHTYNFSLSLLSFESKQTRSCTPCGHYAHLALAQRRETIETCSLFTVTHTFNNANAVMDLRTRNNREFKNNRESTIHSDRHITTHIWDNIFLCYIHPTETYIHSYNISLYLPALSLQWQSTH
jgi:hypothetical protein